QTNRYKELKEHELTIARPIEVLPVPGGPHKIKEGSRFASIADRRKDDLWERRWSCPIMSLIVWGRILSDNGFSLWVFGLG
nr:hypothetical protein [Tanacetum cinerariifolium]